MIDEKWDVLEEVAGSFQAEMLRGLLEAQEIPVVLSQEGAGHVYSVTVGPLGRVQILVPVNQMEQARKLLDDYYAGAFENQEFPEDLVEAEKEDDLIEEDYLEGEDLV
jgi:hypothetical protein